MSTPTRMDDDVLEDSAFEPVSEVADAIIEAEDENVSESPEELDLCQGLAKFQCCDDQDFVADGSSLFCGCW